MNLLIPKYDFIRGIGLANTKQELIMYIYPHGSLDYLIDQLITKDGYRVITLWFLERVYNETNIT